MAVAFVAHNNPVVWLFASPPGTFAFLVLATMGLSDGNLCRSLAALGGFSVAESTARWSKVSCRNQH